MSKTEQNSESEPVNAAQSDTTTDGRRKLLRSLAAGGGVAALGASAPDAWVKPVVDSVVLPAHATTSIGASYSGAVAAPFVSNDGGVLDFFVSSAYAAECDGQTLPNPGAPVCLQETSTGVLISFEGGTGAGTLEQLAGKGILVTAGGLAYAFSGSLTSGVISVSCGGGGGPILNGGNENGGDNGGGNGGGSVISSSYTTVPGAACA